MPQCDFGDHAALYALGLLDHAESAAFERHLAACAGCTAELRESSEIAVALAQTIPPHIPPAALRNRTLKSALSTSGKTALSGDAKTVHSRAAEAPISPAILADRSEHLTGGSSSESAATRDASPKAGEPESKVQWAAPASPTRGDALPRGVIALVRSNEMNWQPTPFPGVSMVRLYADPVRGELASLVRMKPGARYPSHHHSALEHCYVLEGDLIFEDHTLGPGDYSAGMPDQDHASATSTQGCMLFIVHNVRDQVYAR